MRSFPALWLITDAAARTAARRRLTEALERWPGGLEHAPRVQELDARTVLSGDDEFRSGVAWFSLSETASSELVELVGRAEDQQLPALLTRTGDDSPLGTPHHDGVLRCPEDAAPECVAAVLQTMWSQSRVIETLKLESRAMQHHYRGMGDQLGKMDEELRLAAQLQREFLPRELPSLHGVSFEIMWRPAGYVGGDIYDVIRLDENHIGFFVADAVGHGVPAALMTMFIKQSLEIKATGPDVPGGYRILPPRETLAKLNRDLNEQQGGKVRFATACYGVIDCERREVTLARAGHPFPLLLRHDGSQQRLEPDGGLLGVFPEEQFEEVTVQLHEHDRLLIFSDGFETAFPEPNASNNGHAGKPGKLVSERYLDEFSLLSRGDVREALRQLEQRIHDEAGSLDQKDDLTLLCLAVRSPVEPDADEPAAAPMRVAQ